MDMEVHVNMDSEAWSPSLRFNVKSSADPKEWSKETIEYIQNRSVITVNI